MLNRPKEPSKKYPKYRIVEKLEYDGTPYYICQELRSAGYTIVGHQFRELLAAQEFLDEYKTMKSRRSYSSVVAEL